VRKNAPCVSHASGGVHRLRSAVLANRESDESAFGFRHGMPTTHAERINADLLAFIKA
jgi:hypothetical protein